MLKSLVFIFIFIFTPAQVAHAFIVKKHITYEYYHTQAYGSFDFEENDERRFGDLSAIDKKTWVRQIHGIPFNTKILDQLYTKNKGLIYKTIYTSGSWGFRVTPENNLSANYHLIVAGDSNIFGVGIKDSETVSQQLANRFKDYYVYNWGFPARGPSSLLYMLENYSLEAVVPGHKIQGVFVYTFYFYLIERIIGSKMYINWGARTPNYEIDNSGNVYYSGTFEDLFITKVYQFLNSLNFLNVLIPNLPRIGHSHFVKTAKVFAKIKDLYLKQTDVKNKFYVAIRNDEGKNVSAEDWNSLLQEFKKEKIDVIIINEDPNRKISTIAIDGHMNGAGAKVYAEMLGAKLAPLLGGH